jgi:hypothetical protein
VAWDDHQGTKLLVDRYANGHGMRFSLEDQKPQPQSPPAPLLGLFFWAPHFGDLFLLHFYYKRVRFRF